MTGSPMPTSSNSTPLLGIGVDIVAIKRFEGIDIRADIRFLERIFTPREVAYSFKIAHPASSLAGRFALKESIIKALPGDPLTLLDLNQIEVRKQNNGSPEIHQVGEIELEYEIYGSLAHNAEYAVGFAIVIQL